MAVYHDLDTHEALARVLGSRIFAIRSRICQEIVVGGVVEVAIFRNEDFMLFY